MAKSMLEVGKSLEDLEKEIVCAICHDHYSQPKILPCLHYYCKGCILKLALRTGTEKPFPCPECRKEITLPEGNEDNLPSAFFVDRLKVRYTKLEKALNREVECEMCTTSQVEVEKFCPQCNKFLCGECVKSHQRMNAFDGHTIHPLKEALKVGVNNLSKDPPAKKCFIHDEWMKVFCFDCNRVICRDCTVKDHKDHDFEFNQIAALKMKNELMNSLKPLIEMEITLSHALKETLTTQHNLKAQGSSVAADIEASFQELQVIVERRKQQLLEEAKIKVNEKMEKLKLQEKNLSNTTAEVRSLIEYTEQCVRHYSDDEVLHAHAEIGSRIKQQIEEHSNRGSLMSVEELTVGVKVVCADDMEELCQTKANIVELCANLVDGIPNKAEVNKLSEFCLFTTKMCKNRLGKRDVEINSHLKSLCNKSLIKCNIEVVGANEYCIRYTPTIRGRHEFSVYMDRQQVTGSPFPVFVSIPPAQLSKPIKVWGGFLKPIGLAVNSVGEIIVTEYNGNVVVLDKEGKRLRNVNHSEHQIKHLLGVAVDKEDNMYFTDEGTNRIFKSNKDCSKVDVYRVNQVKGPGHLDIAVVESEVMVTERGNNGRIMVYNRELEYVREIVCASGSTLYSLCPDSLQNVYVSDYAQSNIQVFSKDGELIRSFGCDEEGVKKLKNPWGVCVAGGYVYVANAGVRHISVFTTEGNYVTLFGMGHYSSVCVDQDGFVYASDYYSTNSNIMIY